MNNQGYDRLLNPATANHRIRPGLRGMTLKTALWFLLVALFPMLLVTLVLSWYESRSQPDPNELNELETTLSQQATQLAQRIESLERQAHQLKVESAQSAYREAYIGSVADIEVRLIRWLSTTTAEQLAALVTQSPKQAGTNSLDRILGLHADTFAQIALIEIDTKSVIRSRSKGSAGDINKVFPELAKLWDEAMGSFDPTKHWAIHSIGRSNYALAIKSKMPTLQAYQKNNQNPVQPTLEALAQLKQLSMQKPQIDWSIWLILPAFACFIALLGFYWFKVRLLSPAGWLTNVAQQLIEEPTSDTGVDLMRFGLLDDLATSLLRIQNKLKRLDQVDQQRDQDNQTLVEIKTQLDLIRKGQLRLRLPTDKSRHQELALSINQLLDSMVERFESFRRVAQQIVVSAQRIKPAAEGLAKQYQIDSQEVAIEPTALARLVEVHIEELCHFATTLVTNLRRQYPAVCHTKDYENHEAMFDSTSMGFELLNDRILETQTAIEKIAQLRQDAEVLCANMAISAEAKSPTQMERLVEDARSLSRSVVGLHEGLSGSLSQLSQAVNQVRQNFQRTSEQHTLFASRLRQWEKLGESMASMGDELTKHIELVRPGSAALAADLQRLAYFVTQANKLHKRTGDSLLSISTSSAMLMEMISEMLSLLEQVDTGSTGPSSVGARLLANQRALEQALRKLNDLAASEGIESLSQATREILNNIQIMARDAKVKISSDQTNPPKAV